MSEALFNIVFKGKFDRKMEKEKAVLHFSKLFKLPLEKAEKFFDGTPRKLKKSIPLNQASNFRAALKKAGLRVSLDKIQSEEDKQDKITLSEVGVVIIPKPFVQPPHIETSQFSIDEVGVEIVEPVFIEKLDIDLHDYSMDEVGVQLVEKPVVPDADIDTSEISMEEVGATFDEKKEIAEPELNIDSITMEEVGATIVEKKKIPKPDINTDYIKISD